jgi:hypothetical protein
MKQIDIAKKYVGQKELAGNVFTNESELGRKLHEAGQKNGEAWCAYLQEAIFCEAFPEKNKELRKLFSASAVQTFKNFKEAGYDCHEKPKVGDLAIFQKYVDGKPTWQGHAAVVTDVSSQTTYKTIEGNTNTGGSREGDGVYPKDRNTAFKENGLNVLGFVTIG